MADDDDDDASFGGLFEDGYWVWDEKVEALVFVSDLPPKPVEILQQSIKAPTGAIEFRDDVDLIEQIRYRRRYQRKLLPGEPDIITLQDVKDLALYTAPINILSPMLVNMLHLATTERFLRALILYIAYYLQVSEKMTYRVIELQTKVRTQDCDIIEDEFRINLCDLRVLVAKEYATMLIGGNDTKRFHHMGPGKKRQSLSNKDARFIETLLRMAVQIVWLALGRRNFNQVELEIHRLFKSEIFNVVEHNLKTGYISKMAPQERSVLLGGCVRHDRKLKTGSPVMNEIFCHREINFRLNGIGVIQYPKLSNRLKFFWIAVAAKEEEIENSSVVLGIIGMPRSRFDTMLRPLPQVLDKSAKSGICSSRSTRSSHSTQTQSSASVKKSTLTILRLYPEISIPEQSKELVIPSTFPEKGDPARPVSDVQRRRWLNRLIKLMNPPVGTKKPLGK